LQAWAFCALFAAFMLLFWVGPRAAFADGQYPGGPITIYPLAAGTPYPSSVTVSGEGSFLDQINVWIGGFTDPTPSHIDLLLVGPSGASVLLLSDAGAAPADHQNFTVTTGSLAPFSTDPPPQPLAPGSALGGAFAPTNLDDGSDDAFPAPAPAGPYGTSLQALATPTANGVWSLYAVDDTASENGALIEYGWMLQIFSHDPWKLSPFQPTPTPPHGWLESIGTVPVTAERQGSPFNRAGSVSYSTVPVTAPGASPATPGQDFVPQSGKLKWANGEFESRTIDIPLIDDDTQEGEEAFGLLFSDPVGEDLRLPAENPMVFRIADNEPTGPPLPNPALDSANLQHVLKQHGVVVTVTPNVAGTVTASGNILLPGPATVRLKSVHQDAVAGQAVRLKLGLSKKARRKLRAAFKSRKKLKATVQVSLQDARAQTQTNVKKLTLKR